MGFSKEYKIKLLLLIGSIFCLVLFLEIFPGIINRFNKKEKFHPLCELSPDTYVIPENIRYKFLSDLKKAKYVYKAFVQWATSPVDLETIYVNKQGWRNYDLPKAKDNNEYRIFIFGGSQVWGQFTPFNENTIAGHLERICRSRVAGKNIKVINVGERGFSLNQEVVRAITETIYYSPDMFIFIDGFNEIAKIINGNPIDTYYFYSTFKKFSDNSFFNIQKIQNIKRALLGTSRTFNAIVSLVELKFILENKYDNFEKISRQISPADMVQHYESKIKVIKPVCEAHKIKCYFILQPVWYFYKPMKGHYETEIMAYFDKDETFGEDFKKFYLHYYPAQEEFFNNNTSRYNTYSLMKVFANTRDDVYSDPCHTFDAGNKIIAENLFEIIKQDLQ